MREEQIEILVEELSMENFLRKLLPNILPNGLLLDVNCFIRTHEGKQHLKKEIPKKIKAYANYKKNVKVIVLHDQDSADCKHLKQEIKNIIEQTCNIPYLIRIPCRELESWYIGDMDAIEKVYPRFSANKYRNWKKFRNPDNCNAFDELRKIIHNFQKGFASKNIPQFMDINCNKSSSFNVFISGLNNFLSI